MISSENLSFLLGVNAFYGETIIPKGTRGSQLSFKFTIRTKKAGGKIYDKVILSVSKHLVRRLHAFWKRREIVGFFQRNFGMIIIEVGIPVR